MSIQKIQKIKPGIQNYAWGGHDFISDLLKTEKIDRPIAEAWYGDHRLAPSLLIENNIPLNEFLVQHPEVLGEEAVKMYGTKLPFLLKILDVKEMLSLQLHPTKEAALIGFNKESDQRIPIHASHRNYKDDNHKPEILFALSDFWLLQGFSTIEEIKERFNKLLPEYILPNDLTWDAIIHSIWDTQESDYIEYLNTINRNLSSAGIADKNKIYHWISKALKTYPYKNGSPDRGILVMLMMHVQYLQKGEVGYQAPGVLHAYLEGQNIELMANSDNVLRGGLTPKYIDPPELLHHLNTEESGQYLIPSIYLMEDEAAFTPPVKEFMLKHYTVKMGNRKELQFETASILLLSQGRIRIGSLELNVGESIFIPAYVEADVECISTNAEYFLAFGMI